MTNEENLANSLITSLLDSLTPAEKIVVVAEGLSKVDSLLNGIRIVAESPGVMSDEGQRRILAAIKTFSDESGKVAELEATFFMEKLFS